MMRFKLLKILSDGHFHSGRELGVALGVGRSAIWQHVQILRDYGLDIYAVSGRGYRLSSALEWLSEAQIMAALPASARSLVAAIDLHMELESTNTYLMRAQVQPLPTGTVCLAEYQSAGRGRRGRRWHSSFGANLCFSLVWRFNCGPDALSGLSLAVAVAVAQGLSSLGVTQPELKWPNDLYIEGRKLAGILLEMSGESSGVSRVVVGVGVNVGLPSTIDEPVDQPRVALNELLSTPVSRNHAAAVLIGMVVEALARFDKEGLAPFLPQWRQWDVMADRPVTLRQAQGAIEGVARGVDVSGALLIERGGETRRYMAGDVSLLREVTTPR